jgi:hypothetical protein
LLLNMRKNGGKANTSAILLFAPAMSKKFVRDRTFIRKPSFVGLTDLNCFPDIIA